MPFKVRGKGGRGMKTYTVADILAMHPCSDYDEARITELWAGRESLSLPEILALDIPAADRVWVVCHPGVLTAEQMEAWLVDRIITRAVRNHALPCPETRDWAEKWLSGEDRSQGSAWAAADAARAAAADAADDAVWARARAAARAWAAADAAAWAADAAAWAADAAAWAAARAAAADAPWARAESAERELQVADLLNVLGVVE